MQKKTQEPINIREKLVIILTLFLVKMIAPWEFDHQFKDFWEEVKATIK